jgi:hypothetical protein
MDDALLPVGPPVCGHPVGRAVDQDADVFRFGPFPIAVGDAERDRRRWRPGPRPDRRVEQFRRPLTGARWNREREEEDDDCGNRAEDRPGASRSRMTVNE